VRPFIHTPIPTGVMIFIIVSWFIVPYVALRYSEYPMVSLGNSIFVIFILSSLFLLALSLLKLHKSEVFFLILLFLVYTYGLYKGEVSGIGIVDIAKVGYRYLVPLILFALILSSRIIASDTKKTLLKPLLWVAYLNAFYSIYQFMWVEDYKTLWFYNPLINMGFELNSWSYESNGVIRSPGIFTSPLENSYLISLICIYYGLKVVSSHLVYLLPLSFFMIVGYMTGVRTLYVGLLLVFLAWVLITKLSLRSRFVLFVVLPTCAIIVTYLWIWINMDGLDLSALGRLRQLSDMILLLQANPFGYGLGIAGIGKDYSFDSVYGAWFVSLGIIGGFVLVYMYYWISKRLFKIYLKSSSGEKNILVFTLVLFSMDLMYLSQFQYAMSTPVRLYYVFVAGLLINAESSLKERAAEAASLLSRLSNSLVYVGRSNQPSRRSGRILARAEDRCKMLNW